MEAFGRFQPYYGSSPGLNPGSLASIGQYLAHPYPFPNTQLRNRYSFSSSSATNPAAFSGGFPFHYSNSSHCGDLAPQVPLWSRGDPDPAMLWSRGISSPCFRHDHHIVVSNSGPPFSAGNWEIDRRHMIEVQFDQFGVASHCRSTWGRMAPWRPDRFRYSVEEAMTKLRIEIEMLMSRLAVGMNSPLRQEAQDFGGLFPPWTNGYGDGSPMDEFRYISPAIPSIAFLPRRLTFASSHSSFHPNAWNPFVAPYRNYL